MRPHSRGPCSSACFSHLHFAFCFPVGSSPSHLCRPQSMSSTVLGSTARLQRSQMEPSPGLHRHSHARWAAAAIRPAEGSQKDSSGTAGAGEGQRALWESSPLRHRVPAHGTEPPPNPGTRFPGARIRTSREQACPRSIFVSS